MYLLHEPRQAVALDFKDPHIAFVQLVQSAQQRITGELDGYSYYIELTIKDVTPDRITFLGSGKVKNTEFEENELGIPLKIGAMRPLVGEEVGLIQMPGMPEIWVVILDFLTQDTVIFAVGPRETTTS